MGFSLRMALTYDLHGRIRIEELHGARASLFQGGLHRRTSRGGLHTREIQVFRESIVAEITLLQGGPAFEDQRVSQYFDLRDACKDPGKQVIPLEDFPRKSQPLTRLLQAQTHRLHRFDAPGAFTWIIQLRSHAPWRGPVGSKVR